MLDMECIAQSIEDILRITFETKIFYHEANSFGNGLSTQTHIKIGHK